ncbi:hypothetical protein GCWU000324_02010 [Kingella oralis ATCC 51147]|uniref:Uncharacterized protein n=1 Tax=Kingella oralis ATCC 51147 TaxID=629741 RepID=C4GIY7_9NEIS|nr:hypothetical protein GCWU000324_02010 [Kingella oralis ATCC 51147]
MGHGVGFLFILRQPEMGLQVCWLLGCGWVMNGVCRFQAAYRVQS